MCKKIKSEIALDPFVFVSVLEMKLIGACWAQFYTTFEWAEVAPPHSDADFEIYEAIMGSEPFDPFNLRVQAIINRMRSDLIRMQLVDCAFQSQWWTKVEFDQVVAVLSNLPINWDDPLDFHTKTTLLGKTTDDVLGFAQGLVALIGPRPKTPVKIPEDLHRIETAPRDLQDVRGFDKWVKQTLRDCQAIADRIELIPLIQDRIAQLADAPETRDWGDFHARRFLELLLRFGLDAQTEILVDDRFGFKQFLSESDLLFTKGEAKRRSLVDSAAPDFLFTFENLSDWIHGTPGGKVGPTTKKRK
jgi:hypothetical protein